ncbi:PH domain-containing protein [Bacillus aerolatus]|uniref:PH domain-containing protein n=1 Tax=Bacillus aerolatus TaxID=2653354 RepID=A0A6I1FGG1_9BACI|nr:PH domain-containing protein [Bacillus aerolatus]KAB7704801.1 PH domain-containing protein [Bacillus aerolatus]
MSNPKRLHPVAALLNFFKELKELIIPIVFLFFINDGQKSSFWDYLPILGMGAAIVFILISGIVKWLRFTYRVEEEELRIEHGLFVKKKRYIPIERIQSLDVSEGLLQRAFGLVKIKVETAGSSDDLKSEAELTAITKTEAQTLQELISREKRRKRKTDAEEGILEEIENDSKPHIFYKAKFSDLLLLAATSGG